MPEDGKRSLQVGEGAACVTDHEAHITQDGTAGLGSPEDTRGHRLLLFCPAWSFKGHAKKIKRGFVGEGRMNAFLGVVRVKGGGTFWKELGSQV